MWVVLGLGGVSMPGVELTAIGVGNSPGPTAICVFGYNAEAAALADMAVRVRGQWTNEASVTIVTNASLPRFCIFSLEPKE